MILILGQEHRDLLRNEGTTIEEIWQMDYDEKEEFVADNIFPHVENDDEDAETASDLMKIILTWLPGETQRYYPDAYHYVESRFSMPVCNHTSGLTGSDIGFSQGITSGGIPFEAELTNDGRFVNAVFMIPVNAIDEYDFDSDYSKIYIEDSKRDAAEECGTQGINVICFHNGAPCKNSSILDIGMVDDGNEEDISVIQAYVDLLIDEGLLQFTSDLFNGYVFYRTDVRGNRLAEIIIVLKENDEIYAAVSPDFRSAAEVIFVN